MLKVIFKVVFAVFFHIWFYVLLAIFTVIISPFLFLSLLRERDYPIFFWIARQIWSRGILYGMGIFPRVFNKEILQRGKSYILVSNHTSMLDIMLMYVVSKTPFVFVGKQELARYPLFGFFYRKVSILVNRNNMNSRQSAYKAAKKYTNAGYGICMFPEGGIPNPSILLDTFKDGAFRLSLENNIPIVPITFFDNKKRFPYSFLKGSMGVTRALIHPPISPKNQEFSRPLIKESKSCVRGIILKDLKKELLKQKS